jgi:hypothetical protein
VLRLSVRASVKALQATVDTASDGGHIQVSDFIIVCIAALGECAQTCTSFENQLLLIYFDNHNI